MQPHPQRKEHPMPLLRFDLIEGRSPADLRLLLDTAHDVMIECFKAPQRDRYQIVNEHRPSNMITEDTGLNIPRSDKIVLLQVTSRPRSREAKEKFYRRLVEQFDAVCGIKPSDVIVNFVMNNDEDWSFGLGRAQFLTGELT
jgi:hypothetical protein